MSINIKEGEDFSDVPEGYYTQIIHCVLGSDEDPIDVFTQTWQETMEYILKATDQGAFDKKQNVEGVLNNQHPAKVFLIAHGNDDCASGGEVYISNNPFQVFFTLFSWFNNVPNGLDTSIIHLQEYASFESAYSVALAMREGHPLCYNQ
jgi:hypothetical protein